MIINEKKRGNKKHMVAQDRGDLQRGLERRENLGAIAKELGRSPSTISREIKNHLQVVHKGCRGSSFNDCIHRHDCELINVCPDCTNIHHSKCKYCGKCIMYCSQYEKEICPLLTKAPYVCNSCANRDSCTLEKKFYKATIAEEEYKELLVNSRNGIDIQQSEMNRINHRILSGLAKGQSFNHICCTLDNEITQSVSTLYHWQEQNLIPATNLDLPAKYRYRKRSNQNKQKKIESQCLEGRRYEDYLEFQKQYSDIPPVELDSVEGVKGGKVCLTIHFTICNLQLAFIRGLQTLLWVKFSYILS